MKKVIIVHGCPDNQEKDPKKRTYDKHWIPWLKERLEERGFDVYVPLMPKPWEAVYEDWKKDFDNLDINEDSILVGHSCGSAFLVRWLADTKIKIKRLILVAPWKIIYGDYLKKEDKREFYGFEIDKEVRNNVEDIIIFTSDDEEKAGRESAKLFKEALGGKLIELKNCGHYTLEDMETEEFPELLKEVTK
ncbi:MAG: alpha/beta hydrolase [Candidatus Pacearchaeota archaeon]